MQSCRRLDNLSIQKVLNLLDKHEPAANQRIWQNALQNFEKFGVENCGLYQWAVSTRFIYETKHK